MIILRQFRKSFTFDEEGSEVTYIFKEGEEAVISEKAEEDEEFYVFSVHFTHEGNNFRLEGGSGLDIRGIYEVSLRLSK